MMLCDRLVAELHAQNMSQCELARRTGLTQAAVSQLASGKRAPSISTLVKIATVLGVACDSLLGITDPREEADDPAIRALVATAMSMSDDGRNALLAIGRIIVTAYPK